MHGHICRHRLKDSSTSLLPSAIAGNHVTHSPKYIFELIVYAQVCLLLLNFSYPATGHSPQVLGPGTDPAVSSL